MTRAQYPVDPNPKDVVPARPSRKRAWISGLVIVLTVILIGVYFAARRSDSWLIHVYRHQVVRDLGPFYARINASGLSVSDIGRVEYEGAWMQLMVARRVVNDARGHMCIFSGVHGNEPASVEASLRFIETLGKSPWLYPNLDVTVVPLVNPWGWARNLRRNGANKDIARTFFNGNSAEAEMVKTLLKSEKCDLMVDLHGDSSRQAFHVITFENADLSVARAITREVKARGLPVRTGAPDGVFNRRDKDAINNARPNLGLYARRHGIARSYIVQSPRELALEQRVGMHLLALDKLALSLAKPAP